MLDDRCSGGRAGFGTASEVRVDSSGTVFTIAATFCSRDDRSFGNRKARMVADAPATAPRRAS